MQWQEVCEHPSLQNLPFKIELNERGQVLMSPVKVYHSARRLKWKKKSNYTYRQAPWNSGFAMKRGKSGSSMPVDSWGTLI